jgi:DNA-binding HxlR family transcriptional regulator
MIDFSQLDRLIHEKGRLSIMTLLSARGPWSFQELKGELEQSDGNLITHLRTLIKEDYVREDKATALDSERPRTTYEITPKGRAAFKAYIKVLESIVKHSKPH